MSQAASQPASPGTGRAALVTTAVGLAALVWLFWPTLTGMVTIWIESETFSHGFLVFPGCAWLIWRMRDELAAIPPRPSWLGLVLLTGFMAIWVVARLGSVQVAEQFAFVFALISIVWSIAGTAVVRQIAFPLGFLLFAVPFGEVAIPALMKFTAWFTVVALKLTGIPVYQDGFLLSIPSGDFEVAKACSGIRYAIASFSLGTLFAYLTFYSWRRRVAFMAFSLILPIVANGLRAYGIVMLAHLSGMKYAVGVDHLIYGWLFFGIVMFLAFWIGSAFRDEPTKSSADDSVTPARSGSLASMVVVLVLAVATMAAARWLVSRAESGPDARLQPPGVPVLTSDWRGPLEMRGAYRPAFLNFDYEQAASYERDGQRIDVFVQSYTSRDNELINALNFIANGDTHTVIESNDKTVAVNGAEWSVTFSTILGSDGRRNVLHWFQIGDRRATSAISGKIHETLNWLRAEPGPRSLVAVSMLDSGEFGSSGGALEQFLSDHGAALVACIGEPASAACSSAQGGR